VCRPRRLQRYMGWQDLHRGRSGLSQHSWCTCWYCRQSIRRPHMARTRLRQRNYHMLRWRSTSRAGTVCTRRRHRRFRCLSLNQLDTLSTPGSFQPCRSTCQPHNQCSRTRRHCQSSRSTFQLDNQCSPKHQSFQLCRSTSLRSGRCRRCQTAGPAANPASGLAAATQPARSSAAVGAISL
jgi:hypothetical protein